MKKVGVALLGLGTVGGGTYRILTNNRGDIRRKYGVDIEVKHILEKDVQKAVNLGVDPSIVSTDIENVIKDDGISIVAEFFGGIEPAKTFLIKALKAGKSIVTANKELFSKHWDELREAAEEGKSGLYFEASCVGGVPIIRTLTEGMQGNNIKSLMGIVNGTTNYILTKMADEGAEYADALAEAQRLGYAEANPTADVDGYDSMYKLSILSTLAFHKRVRVENVYREGISKVTKKDIDFGKSMGYTLKLLAICKNTKGKIEARVHPAFIKNDHPLATVKGSFNAVHIVGDNVGDIMLYGRGAGDLPTGSAIVSDIVYASTHKPQNKYYQVRKNARTYFSKDFSSEYYLRLTVTDESGVLAKIAKAIGSCGVSINVLQQLGAKDGLADISIMTHITNETDIRRALAKLEKLACVKSVDSLIRVV